MPILKGTISYTRYKIDSDVRLSPEDVVEKLKLFRFRPLHPHGEDVETMGWTPYLSEYDPEKSIETKDCYYDGTIILVLRCDTMVIPKLLLKALVKAQIRDYQKEFGKYPDKTVKKELELAQVKALRARILPKSKFLEVAWCIKTNELKVLSRSSTLLDRFAEMFQQTFLLSPIKRDFSYETYRESQKLQKFSSVESLAHQPLFIPALRTEIQ